MPGTVTFDGTTITQSEAGDSGSWDTFGAISGSGQLSDSNYQGTQCAAARVDNQNGGRGFDNGSGINMSAAGTHVGWMYRLTQGAGALDTNGVRFQISNSGAGAQSGNWDGHTLAPADYPEVGGWQMTWVHLDRTRDAGSGTLNQASCRNFGVKFDVINTIGNATNVMYDGVYYSSTGGLTVTGGTVPSPATIADFVTFDPDTTTNRMGVVLKLQGALVATARLTVGSTATAVVFDDVGFSINFGEQPFCSVDWLGFTCSIENASTTINMVAGSISSKGTSALGDFIVTGDVGMLMATACVFDRLRTIEATDACTFSGCNFLVSGVIDAGGADFSGSSVINSTATAALLWDVATNTDGLLDNMSFTSDGAGHAIELGPNTPAAVKFNGHSYSGYAVIDGSTGNEALYNDSGGAVEVDLGGGPQPTVRNGTGASTTFVNNATQTFTGLIAGSTLVIHDRELADPQDKGTELHRVASTGTSEDFVYVAAANLVIVSVYRAGYRIYEQELQLSGTDASFAIIQELETN